MTVPLMACQHLYGQQLVEKKLCKGPVNVWNSKYEQGIVQLTWIE
jgi:hypothetical protein